MIKMRKKHHDYYLRTVMLSSEMNLTILINRFIGLRLKRLNFVLSIFLIYFARRVLVEMS